MIDSSYIVYSSLLLIYTIIALSASPWRRGLLGAKVTLMREDLDPHATKLWMTRKDLDDPRARKLSPGVKSNTRHHSRWMMKEELGFKAAHSRLHFSLKPLRLSHQAELADHIEICVHHRLEICASQDASRRSGQLSRRRLWTSLHSLHVTSQ